MSYSEMYIIGSDYMTVIETEEYRNSHGLMHFVFNTLCKIYCSSERQWFFTEGRCLNSVFSTMKDFEQIVYLSVTDSFFMEKKSFPLIIESYERFYNTHRSDSRVCHLPSVIRLLKKYKDSDDCSGACFYLTSFVENCWRTYDEETGDDVLYNFNTGTNHFNSTEYIGNPED